MEKSFSESYKASGVDITAGYRAVELMKEHVRRTRTSASIDDIGGFGGCVDISSESGDVLVSGTDGVGTKLRLAFLMDRHDSVGIDCVAMCVNDIVCTGAKPLLFLDYIACGKNHPEKIAAIVKGVSEGCIQAGCALVGGETAEMPGFYSEDEYDLAGFSTGIVRRSDMLVRENVKPSDVIIALASSGVHSNGFSLVRKVFNIEDDPQVLTRVRLSDSRTLGQALLEPTKIYVRQILALTDRVRVHSVCHITGGGFYENIPRALPEGCTAVIRKADIRTPEIFSLIASAGSIPERDMFNTFNMGVGMAVITAAEDEKEALEVLNSFEGTQAYTIGRIEKGERGVRLW